MLNRSASAQEVHVPLAGWLRDGVAFTTRFPAGGPTASSAGGEVVVTVPALSGLVLVANAGQDLTGPAAPAYPHATARRPAPSPWTGRRRRRGRLRVYRSVVSGGGYEADRRRGRHPLRRHRRHQRRPCLLRRPRPDAAGNEGAASPEAGGPPFFPIGCAVLQWPPDDT